MQPKDYLYKVYDEDDNYVGIWDDVINEPHWSEELNRAGSAVEVELARNSDSIAVEISSLLDNNSLPITDSNDLSIDTSVESANQIGPGSNVNHNYRVEILVVYGNTGAILDSDYNPITDSNDEDIEGNVGAPNGRRKFSGFISDISSRYGNSETTLVTLMSFGFDLDQYVVNQGGITTVAFNSYDPGSIVREGMSLFNLEAETPSWSTASVDLTGTIASYTFKVSTYLELLQKAVELAPSDWYWCLDMSEGLINFKPRSATPDHLFYLGDEIKSLQLRSSIENSVSEVYFSGGEVSPGVDLLKHYTASRAANTRHGLKRLSDNRVTLDDSADILSEGELAQNNRIQYRSTIEILDTAYDIETIHLGQVIGFRNFGNYIDDLTLQIVGKEYEPDMVTLQLDNIPPRISKRVEDIKRALTAQQTENVPVEPT